MAEEPQQGGGFRCAFNWPSLSSPLQPPLHIHLRVNPSPHMHWQWLPLTQVINMSQFKCVAGLEVTAWAGKTRLGHHKCSFQSLLSQATSLFRQRRKRDDRQVVTKSSWLTCLLYISSCVRAVFAFFSSSSRLTVLCMYIIFVSCRDFTCLRKSFRSSSFLRYTSTADSSLFALSAVILQWKTWIEQRVFLSQK